MRTKRRIRDYSKARKVQKENWETIFEKGSAPTESILKTLHSFAGCWLMADAVLVQIIGVESKGRVQPWIAFRAKGILYYSEPLGLSLSIAVPVRKQRPA